jgi:hypothetical protein
MVFLGRRGGFTTMLRQLGAKDFTAAVTMGVGFWGANQTGFKVDDGLGQFLVGATGQSVWPVSNILLNTFLGDVNIGGRYTNSDWLKRLAYHELGHASHYAGSSNTYYRSIIAAEVGADGHGDPSVNLAGHIQIAESWAEHMALTMIKQTYPASLSTTSHEIGNNWAERHEGIRNESLNHIPIGVYLDLIDGVTLREYVIDENKENASILRDGVNRGYTNAFFARNLDGSIRSPDDLRNLCLDNLPRSTSRSDVISLFEQY